MAEPTEAGEDQAQEEPPRGVQRRRVRHRHHAPGARDRRAGDRGDPLEHGCSAGHRPRVAGLPRLLRLVHDHRRGLDRAQRPGRRARPHRRRLHAPQPRPAAVLRVPPVPDTDDERVGRQPAGRARGRRLLRHRAAGYDAHADASSAGTPSAKASSATTSPTSARRRPGSSTSSRPASSPTSWRRSSGFLSPRLGISLYLLIAIYLAIPIRDVTRVYRRNRLSRSAWRRYEERSAG